MLLVEILAIAVGLSMDALAVSVGVAAADRRMAPRANFRLPFHFGLFQCLMPIAGWFLGSEMAGVISSAAVWLAWLLLTIVGGHMVYSGIAHTGEAGYSADPSRGFTLIVLSLATSMDALAVGFSLAMLGVSIWYPAVVIGIVTGTLSLMGLLVGKQLGRAVGERMEIAGGALLLAIGLRILITGGR